MSVGDVPLDVLCISFLKEMRRRNYLATVVAQETGTIGRAPQTVVTSNGGPDGVDVARYALLHQGKEADMVERVAKAFHELRFVEQGQTAPPPEMDMCTFGACIAAQVGPSADELKPAARLTWTELPEELRDGHRLVARLLIATAMKEPAQEPKSKIVPA